MKGFLLSIILVIFLLNCLLVIAEPSDIKILDISYDNGSYTLIDSVQGYGYYPKRLNQPKEGDLLVIKSKEHEILYSFRFVPPNIEFTDVLSKNGSLGGIIVHKKYNFSFVIPSYKNEKEIIIYSDKKDKESLLSRRNMFSGQKYNLYIYGFFILIIIIYLIVKKKYKSQIKN